MMGRGARKSRYSATSCDYGIADKCRGFVNFNTMKEPNMCHPCWQKKHAKKLNQRHNFWSREGSKRKMMQMPIELWNKYYPVRK